MKTFLATLLVLVSYLLPAQNKVIDSLEKIVSMHTRDTMEMDALLHLTNELLRKDLEKAKAYDRQLIALARARENNLKLANGYSYMVVLHQNGGRPDSASYYLGRLEELSMTVPTNSRIRISYAQSAGLFYKNQGQYRKALPYMLDNLSLLTAENENKAGQLLNIGNTYQNLSDFENAVRYHLQSLSLFDKLKNKRGQSFCLQNLGNDFMQLRQLGQAERYYMQALRLKEELEDKRGTITAYTGLGDVAIGSGKVEVAEKYYQQALQLSREMKLVKEESRCLFQLGLLYEKTRDVPHARENMIQSLKLAKQSGDSTLAAKIDSQLNALRELEKSEKETEAALFANLNAFVNSGDRASVALGYSRLSEFYASDKQFDKAFYFLKKHQQLKDSVEGKAVLLQMKHLEEQYKSVKKEQEIELLKKEQALHDAEIKRQQAYQTLTGIALVSVIIISLLLINRYRIMNRTKRELEMEHMRQGIARDLHDDIGSTLSSINIMSQLALNESGEATHQLKKIVTQSANMMETMSDIVWSINPGNDSVEQMIHKMKEFAGEILEPRNMDYHFEVGADATSILLSAEKRKNLFLIYKEAINNAAKYSGGSRVDVLLHRENGSLHLGVRDNGKGFDPSTTKNGNGLKNMQARATALKGSLTRKSVPNTGTEIFITLPIT